VIHGPAALRERLADTIRRTLCRPRDAQGLVRDVADMRDRIALHAPPKSEWDFKHLPGGLFDIDFTAQFLALRHAAAHPEILHPHPAEMLRRVERLGFLDKEDSSRLQAARSLLADVQSLLRLTLDGDEAAFDAAKAPEGQRRLIAVTEGVANLEELRTRIATETARVRAIYRRIVEEPARAAGWQARGQVHEATRSEE